MNCRHQNLDMSRGVRKQDAEREANNKVWLSLARLSRISLDRTKLDSLT